MLGFLYGYQPLVKFIRCPLEVVYVNYHVGGGALSSIRFIYRRLGLGI